MPAEPSGPPRWEDLSPRWPFAQSSRFVQAGGLEWHLQQAGRGPLLLLVHGTGAATFSFGPLLPFLTGRFTVLAPDLPGHGFTSGAKPAHLTLPGMASALSALLRHEGLAPAFAVGHSAGAAVLLRLAIDRAISPAGLVGLAPALVPPPAVYRLLFAPLVHRLATTRVVASSAAALARNDGIIASLLDSTGSAIPPDHLVLYQRFFRSPQHVADAFAMMSGWSLTELTRDLYKVPCPVTIAAGTADRWIPLGALRRLAAMIPRLTFTEVAGGHLFHEDRPQLAAETILAAADRAGL